MIKLMKVQLGTPSKMTHVKMGTYACFLLGLFADTSACKHWLNCNCNKLQHSTQY